MNGFSKSKEEALTNYILSTPPGQIKNVLDDILKIKTESTPEGKAAVQKAVRNYDETQFTTVHLESIPNTILLSKFNVINSPNDPKGINTYFDPISKVQFSFEHHSRSTTDVKPNSYKFPNESTASFCEAAIKTMSTYVKERFPNGAFGIFPTDHNGSPHLVLCIEGHQYNLSNFWSSKWRSQWFIPFTAGQDNVKVTGWIDVLCHYFEDGNTQLQCNKDFKESTDFTVSLVDATTFGTDIAKGVESAEQKYHVAVNRKFETVSMLVKQLRRVRSVTRTKFQWSKLPHIAIANDINKTS